MTVAVVISPPISVDGVTLEQSATGVISIKPAGVGDTQLAGAIPKTKLAAGVIAETCFGGSMAACAATSYCHPNGAYPISGFASNVIACRFYATRACTIQNLRGVIEGAGVGVLRVYKNNATICAGINFNNEAGVEKSTAGNAITLVAGDYLYVYFEVTSGAIGAVAWEFEAI